MHRYTLSNFCKPQFKQLRLRFTFLSFSQAVPNWMTGLGVRTSGPQKQFQEEYWCHIHEGFWCFTPKYSYASRMSLSFDRTQEKFLRCRKMSPTMFIQKLSETIKSCSFGKIVCDINLKYKPLSVLSVLSLYIVRAFLCLFPSFLYKVSELQNRLP